MSRESRDIGQQRFKRLHSREVCTRRADEINAAAKQAHEYFRNSCNPDYFCTPPLDVLRCRQLKPGSRSIAQGERREEGLTQSHRLEAVSWGQSMFGRMPERLRNLRQIKIRRRSGLFSDFVEHTRNTALLKVGAFYGNSGLFYDILDKAVEISANDLILRIPDAEKDRYMLSGIFNRALVHDLSYNNEDGLRVEVD